MTLYNSQLIDPTYDVTQSLSLYYTVSSEILFFPPKFIFQTNSSVNAYLMWVNYSLYACIIGRQYINLIRSSENTKIEIWIIGESTLTYTWLSVTQFLLSVVIFINSFTSGNIIILVFNI